MAKWIQLRTDHHDRGDNPMDRQPSSASTLSALLERRDAHPALVVPSSSVAVGYDELHTAVQRIAGELAGAGVRPGDSVAMSFANEPQMVLCFLGIVAAGAAAAPQNPAYTADELVGYLSDLRPRLMLVHGRAGDACARACERLGIEIVQAHGSSAANVSLQTGRPAGTPPAGDPDTVALLLHTSGTTSKPKVVPLRQRNLAMSIRSIAQTYGLGPDDVSHCVMPLFHVHGLVASTLTTLATGGTVLVAPRFSATSFWSDTVTHGATWYSAVPTIHGILTARATEQAAPDHGLRFARSCSSALPGALQEEAEERLRVPLVQAYGMTEASHQMTSNPLPPDQRRPGSVGQPTGVEVAILDDQWRLLDAGRTGEVAVRGPSVVDGYRDNPEANASQFREGWFRTGDLGSLSPDGYLTLEGRIKEMINRGGEKISPLEIEDVLLRHPAVSEAAVYGRPDAKYGEQVAAAVVAGDGATESTLQTHCAAMLAEFKVPVSVAIVDEIPKGPTGKVQRRLLAGLVQT
jgi:acyl-CoA synthetase (AMP-forming)/AMP-acid ligase II